ncbi:MAG: protein kinase [Polyangia bacterium]
MQPDPHAATLTEPGTQPQSKTGASMLGRILKGSYRIDGVLGQGAMGTVYRGTQLGIDKTVAIKVIRADGFSSDAAHDRFQREATLVSKLLHPGIAQVLDFGFEDDMPFLVMEFVEGKELTEVLAAEGPMPPARALAIVRQLASALGEAHAHGVVHRDIKPQNLRLMRYVPGGQIFLKVLDFGIAKQLDEAEQQKLTATGAVIGTPMYMAPEQAGSSRVDARADQYAVGIVLYELLTGTVPFTGETLTGVLVSHLTRTPPPLPRQVPEPLQKLVMRLLSKRPDDRFPDMAALDQALGACEPACRDVPPLGAGKVQPHRAGGIAPPTRPWPTLLIGGGAITFAVVVLGAVLLLGSRLRGQDGARDPAHAQAERPTAGALATGSTAAEATPSAAGTSPAAATGSRAAPVPPPATASTANAPGNLAAANAATASKPAGEVTPAVTATRPAAGTPSKPTPSSPSSRPAGTPAPAVEPPAVKDKLDDAEAALKRGDLQDVVRLVRQANATAPSSRGFRLLTEAHCRQGSFDAKAPFFRVARADRARLIALCRQHDVDLVAE